MTEKINDKLSEIIGTNILSDRIHSFAWICIASKNPELPHINPNSNKERETIAELLTLDLITQREIQQSIKHKLIPDHYLDWIVDSQRQALWIEQHIKESLEFGMTDARLNPNSLHNLMDPMSITQAKPSLSSIRGLRTPNHLHGKNLSIALIDYWTCMTTTGSFARTDQTKSMRLAWENHIKEDKIFAWLDTEDSEKKRDYFWEWLEAKDKTITQNRPKFQSHEDLLIFFDNPRFGRSDKEVLSQNCRKTWSQKKNREEMNGKKQCNFVLPEKTISNLKKLSQKHGLTRTEIIELIIDSETKNETYISERLRRLNALKTSL